jgi:ABC-type multidrug transport system fused ATPase/permease subunit
MPMIGAVALVRRLGVGGSHRSTVWQAIARLSGPSPSSCLFARTIRDNLTLSNRRVPIRGGSAGGTRRRHAEMMALPQGYDTRIEEQATT